MVFLFSILLLFLSFNFVKAQSSDCNNTQSLNLHGATACLAELQKALDLSRAATAPLESQLNNYRNQIEGIKRRVSQIEASLIIKSANIEKGYEDFAEQKAVFDKTVTEHYIDGYNNNLLAFFLSGNSAAELIQNLAYQKAKANQDKSIITNIALLISDLETQKKSLEAEQASLASLKANLDAQSKKLDEIVSGAKAYQSTLSGQIATLTALQQSILTGRSGTFTVSIGNSELADDYYASITGFREQAPSGSFAVFSFGAYTHRKGMSQYGARGRAQDGQNYKQILSKYYGKEPVVKDTGGDINVSGYGSMNFEDRYLMGIAEMPSAWHTEALKAQAIAARTYAYRYKLSGDSICTTEACQVFSSSKADNPPDAWKQAVQSTRGEIIEDVVTYYSSTAGGYLTTSGWDTTDGSGGSNFVDKTYEKKGGSPWLYKAWYTQHYSINSDKCGRSNPWLSPQEMADIVNAAIAFRNGGIDTSRITPITTSCWGGNPYSMDELRNLVSGGISSATSVSVSQGDGSTSNVTINGISMTGAEFKKAFNLRAPGRLSIPQSGFGFYNIEKK